VTHAPLIRFFAVGAAFAALSLGDAASAKPPTNWDGLAQVKAKNVDLLYLRPGADFSQYKAIVLDPTEVAFKKDWHKDINRSRRGAARYSEADVRRAIDAAQDKLRNTFEKRFQETGFQVVPGPAENALRVFVGVANVDVTAPEIKSHGISRSYAEQAGHATLVVEVRDSLTGELLGRAVDHGAAGDSLAMLRTSSTNWADFEHLFDEWARISAKGFQKLIASPPQPAQ
jgi:hypothetical protein